MKEVYKQCLLKNREDLRDQVLFRHVAPQLINKGILSEEDWRQITFNEKTNSEEEKIDCLVDILLSKEDKAFDVLLTALTPHYWWLVAQLMANNDINANSHKNREDNRNRTHENKNTELNRTNDVKSNGCTKITSDMVKAMKKNVHLLRNWYSIARRLGLNCELINVQTRINKECMDQDNCIALLLEMWQNKCPSQATLENLIGHFRAEDFNEIADTLEVCYLSQ